MTSSRVTPASGVGVRPGDREVIRLAPPVVLWWVWLAFVALNVIDYADQGLPSARFGAVISAILLLVTGLVYTLALRPRVVMDVSGLTVVNPFRVHHVPWRLITSVDTGEWVRVRYGDGRKLQCWALYVSARARRSIASGGARPRRGIPFGSRDTARWLAGEAGSDGPSSRLPDEARYLASLPVAKAIAVRLDKRAERERARKPTPGASDEPAPAMSASWSWHALAVVAVPALILLAVAVA
ncbi:MAG TPA: PH domain-containing protein [Trebonia sp.]|jgi:hypothetical protein|nr:PH domain-containing protein [Trebonia sp.]